MRLEANIDGTSSGDRPAIDPVPSRQRSRITNGKLLPGDNRGPWARRCKDLIAEHLSDLGGVDNTSAAERSIVRRIGVLTVELEALEAKFAMAGQADAHDLDLYQRCSGNLRRLLESIGLQRRARDVGPSLGELMLADIADRQREAAVESTDASVVDPVPDTAQDKTLTGESRKGTKQPSKKHPEAKPDDAAAASEGQPA